MMHCQGMVLPWPPPWAVVGVVDVGNACCIHSWIHCYTRCTDNRCNIGYWTIVVAAVVAVDSGVVDTIVDVAAVGDDGDGNGVVVAVDVGKLHCCSQVLPGQMEANEWGECRSRLRTGPGTLLVLGALWGHFLQPQVPHQMSQMMRSWLVRHGEHD